MTYLRRFEALLGGDWFALGRLLVLAPHPDDEVLACGGLIGAHRQRGLPVDVVVMTDGALGTASGHGDARYVEERRAETILALEDLGGCDATFLGFPDGALAGFPDAAARLGEVIRAQRPATIVFPSPFEVHPDHRATALHCAAALEGIDGPERLLACEIGAFMPSNVLLDITPLWPQKERAIGRYRSQMLHQDLLGKVRALNRARTVNVDDKAIEYVEAYTAVDPARLRAYMEAAERVSMLIDAMGPHFG